MCLRPLLEALALGRKQEGAGVRKRCNTLVQRCSHASTPALLTGHKRHTHQAHGGVSLVLVVEGVLQGLPVLGSGSREVQSLRHRVFHTLGALLLLLRLCNRVCGTGSPLGVSVLQARRSAGSGWQHLPCSSTAPDGAAAEPGCAGGRKRPALASWRPMR